MFEPLVDCLEKICTDGLKEWDRETISKAAGHLLKLKSSDFLAAFKTVRFCFRWVEK